MGFHAVLAAIEAPRAGSSWCGSLTGIGGPRAQQVLRGGAASGACGSPTCPGGSSTGRRQASPTTASRRGSHRRRSPTRTTCWPCRRRRACWPSTGSRTVTTSGRWSGWRPVSASAGWWSAARTRLRSGRRGQGGGRHPAAGSGSPTWRSLGDFARSAKESGFWVLGAEARGDDVSGFELPDRILLCLGAEAGGLRAKTRAPSMFRGASRWPPGVESLNLSVAAGILAWEWRRRYPLPRG